MDDDQLTIFSARAIFKPAQVHIGTDARVWIRDYYPKNVRPRMSPWKPLDDGHQALMLLEKLGLQLVSSRPDPAGPRAFFAYPLGARVLDMPADNPRRAIVTAAAKLWQAEQSRN